MDDHNELFAGEIAQFRQYSRLIDGLYTRNSAGNKQELERIIDQLNNIEYVPKLFPEQAIAKLVYQICRMVPPHDDMLLSKTCQLIINTISKTQLILRTYLEEVTEFLVSKLATAQAWMFTDLLWALSAVIYENGGLITDFHDRLVGVNGLLIQLVMSDELKVSRAASQCIENITYRIGNAAYLEDEHQEVCLRALLQILQIAHNQHAGDIIQCKRLMCALKGIQNVMTGTRTSTHHEMLGPLLAALKAYMLHGLPSQPSSIPTSLYPIPMSTYDPNPGPNTTAAASKAAGADPSTRPSTSKNRRGRRRKGGGAKGGGKPQDDVASMSEKLDDLSLGDGLNMNMNTSATAAAATAFDPSVLYPVWSKVSSSDSEYSDTEGGQANRLKNAHGKVRQCALGCLHALIKASDKRVMFGYWQAFVPDSPGVGTTGGQTLFTAIMKDPSPRARTGALAVLTALVDGSKQYLMAAEESDSHRPAPFTPFSVTLGHMIKEMHRCLMLSLSAETSPLAITQIIKCVGTLIPNVPYHRLKPGLLGRVVKQLRPLLHNRDPNIRVACLTCLGSVCSVQAPLLEVCYILQGNRQHRGSEATGMGDTNGDRLTPGGGKGSDSHTPVSGTATPSLLESAASSDPPSIPWMVRLCLRNVAPHLLHDVGMGGSGSGSGAGGGTAGAVPEDGDAAEVRAAVPVQPLPVRLEALQLLAHLAKHYFPLVRSCVMLLRDVAAWCLMERDPSVQLHGAYLLEELGAVILQYTTTAPTDTSKTMEVSEAVSFWLPVLAGPVPHALQSMELYAVRATVCDALANIGPPAFAALPLDKHILCITLLLGMTNDEDHNVQAAAVRALGVYVLYPNLREDVSFVADAANAVIKATEAQFTHIRVKAAWSLGNLSDALLMNKMKGEQEFVDDFSDMLLLKLFEVAITHSQDYDKVKANAVRALGNLLRYLPERSYKKSLFNTVLEKAIEALVKNITTGTMKVRWNACYAAGNMFNNSLLPVGTAKWGQTILQALCTVVVECRNYKVRINAALALGVPCGRASYGKAYPAAWSSLVGALRAADDITDFAEYRYRDSLTEQICSTIVHVATLLGEEDVGIVGGLVKEHRTLLTSHLQHYMVTVHDGSDEHAEKVAAVQKCVEHLKQLATKAKDADLSVLIDLLSAPPPKPEVNMSVDPEEKPGLESAFVPSFE